VALEAVVAVPVGFTMPGEQDPCHGRLG
jgi:hypothetical protein